MSAWITQFRVSGWPDKVTIHAEFTDGKNGQPYQGSIPLYMRKGDDANTDEELGGVTADVVDGKWDLSNENFTTWNDDGFDTLVFDCGGRKIPRTLPRMNRENKREGTRSDIRGENRDASPTFQFTSFDLREKTEVKDAAGKLTGYNLKVTGTVIKNEGKKKSSAADIKIALFCENSKTDEIETDGDGNFTYTFRNIPPAPDGIARLQVGVKDAAIRSKSLDADVPFPTKPPSPKYSHTARLAKPHPDKNGWFNLSGTIQKDGKPADDVSITLVSSPEVVNVKSIVGEIAPASGENFSIRTQNGVFTYLLQFADPDVTEANLVHILGNCSPIIVPIVKPID